VESSSVVVGIATGTTTRRENKIIYLEKLEKGVVAIFY